MGDQWSGTSIKTKWANQKFEPVAWDGKDVMRTRMNAPPMRRVTPNFPHHNAAIPCMLR
jgi:hypothetical protein